MNVTEKRFRFFTLFIFNKYKVLSYTIQLRCIEAHMLTCISGDSEDV